MRHRTEVKARGLEGVHMLAPCSFLTEAVSCCCLVLHVEAHPEVVCAFFVVAIDLDEHTLGREAHKLLDVLGRVDRAPKDLAVVTIGDSDLKGLRVVVNPHTVPELRVHGCSFIVSGDSVVRSVAAPFFDTQI